ncbi:MAG: hypothetical protein JRI70_07470, partial [Deltaproteobacteria bacterium]|nr:hypothetical protein [Deltaproteobacteria bacterium]
MMHKKPHNHNTRLFLPALLCLVFIFGFTSYALAGLDLEVPLDMVDHGFVAPDGASTTNFNR